MAEESEQAIRESAHESPRLLGYARVSTDDQHLRLQIDALTKQGIPTASIFMDKVSGAKTERPGLAKCLATLQSGDVLVVWRLDRLGRSMRHLITLIQERTKAGLAAARARGRNGGRPKIDASDAKVVMAKKLHADKSLEIDDICK
ncbi:MAG: invertase, partial [Planctomycetes bacterium RBG_16_64_12]